MKELVMMVIRSLVDHPDDIELNSVEGTKTTVFELKVHPDDVGKVIGKKGRTINAIRTVLKAVVIRDSKRIILELLQ
ncbi:MAG: KH domain-containing protein [bacterium]|nr:KH domain-containing protein [bacterium]